MQRFEIRIAGIFLAATQCSTVRSQVLVARATPFLFVRVFESLPADSAGTKPLCAVVPFVCDRIICRHDAPAFGWIANESQ